MSSAARVTKPPKKVAIPSLENGDHLTVAEFHRRYEAMPEVKKAELLNGVVYMGSPVRLDHHGEPHANMSGWLFIYRANTPGLQGGDNATMRTLVGDHEPQPDNCLRILEEFGGQSKIDADGYLIGAAELTAEVSASSAALDLHDKLTAYEQNGVREYIVWRVEEKEIDWFISKRGKFQRLAQTKDGIFKSKVFPGLWLDPKAMITGDLTRVIEVVQQGIASPEHRRFMAKLAAKKK